MYFLYCIFDISLIIYLNKKNNNSPINPENIWEIIWENTSCNDMGYFSG